MTFYPENTHIPKEKRTHRLLLRPLLATDVKLDYDAVMESKEQLRRWSQGSWPTDDFTLAENQVDLERHELEHKERKAFTFTVLNPEETNCLGCVYIEPLPSNATQFCADASYPTNVAFWVRSSELVNDLDKHLFAMLREWLASEWAFDCFVFMVSQQEVRQIALLDETDLKRAALTLPDGRTCWVYR